MIISVTDLDQLRYYRMNETMELDEVISRLSKKSEPTPAMLAGTAFHEILENLKEGDDLLLTTQNGLTFRFEGDMELSLPKIRELKGEKQYLVNGVEVTLVGKVDAIDGAVYDHKLSKTIDAEKYTDALQWRCYLDIFNAKKFVYNVFQGYPEAKTGDIVVRDFMPFTFYAYPEMRKDIEIAIADFIDFAKQYLPDKLLTNR